MCKGRRSAASSAAPPAISSSACKVAQSTGGMDGNKQPTIAEATVPSAMHPPTASMAWAAPPTTSLNEALCCACRSPQGTASPSFITHANTNPTAAAPAQCAPSSSHPAPETPAQD